MKQLTPYERPERADRVVEALKAARLGPIESPSEFPVSHAMRVHRPDYVEFLRVAHVKWTNAGGTGDALPTAWAIRGMRSDRFRPPSTVSLRPIGHHAASDYLGATVTSITRRSPRNICVTKARSALPCWMYALRGFLNASGSPGSRHYGNDLCHFVRKPAPTMQVRGFRLTLGFHNIAPLSLPAFAG
jgi:hypothetical protein